MPEYAYRLANLYWQLRNVRDYDLAARRRWYRRIAVEKKRLRMEGVEGEELRLLCLCLASPNRAGRWERLQAYRSRTGAGAANCA